MYVYMYVCMINLLFNDSSTDLVTPAITMKSVLHLILINAHVHGIISNLWVSLILQTVHEKNLSTVRWVNQYCSVCVYLGTWYPMAFMIATPYIINTYKVHLVIIPVNLLYHFHCQRTDPHFINVHV